jgi:DNA-binding PadR family transcriptional regulator
MNDDFAILASIAAAPAHPYRILDHLNTLGVKATRSTLYRRVDALTQDGLLAVNVEKGVSGHAQRQLTLTRDGHDRVALEAATALRVEPLESPLFALAVACAQAADSDELPRILRERLSSAARRLTDEELGLRSEDSDDYWSRTSRLRRIAHLQADVKWLQSVMRDRLVPAGQATLPRAG